MLGWEFPPHISGGLGTACHGLSLGLVRSGVEVTFVVPQLRGGEEAEGVRLVAAADVPVPVGAPAGPARSGQAAPTGGGVGRGAAAEGDVPVRLRHAYSGRRGPDGLGEREERTELARARLLAVDSPLRPYMTEHEYARELAELERLAALRQRREPSAPQPGPARAAAPPPPPPRERLPFRGGYGPDLFAEVERYARVVRELARQVEFDVVHAHDWMTWPAGIAAAEQAQKPLVVHVHASEHDRSGKHPDARIRAVEERGLARADAVVCVSEYTAGVLKRHYGAPAAKLRVVHNALTRREQRERLHAEKTIDDPVVLFLGRITYQKGPDYFLEAAARVLRVLPDVRFVLSGTGDMLPRTIERAAQLGIAGSVHFTGFLRGEEVERMFALADIYVMPSVSEPFGISPLEAMALDVPVIVSRQSGVSEVLANALKVDFWDVEDLANKIIALLSYPALREALLAEGRHEVERMTWEDRGRTLRGVYEELRA